MEIKVISSDTNKDTGHIKLNIDGSNYVYSWGFLQGHRHITLRKNDGLSTFNLINSDVQKIFFKHNDETISIYHKADSNDIEIYHKANLITVH